MFNRETELLDAERRGRALAALLDARPGEAWQVCIGSGPDAGALAAAARWAERFGAAVSKRLAPANRLVRIRGGRSDEIFEIPPARAALTLPPSAAWRFVKPDDGASLRLSSAQCRAVDQKAIAFLGVPGLCLMENASLDALTVAMDMLRPSRGRVLVAAGGGNNGGDGLALARMFLELGVKAEVAILKPPARLSGDAEVNYRLFAAMPGAVVYDMHEQPRALSGLAESSDLVVDALLGTGFKGKPSPAFKAAIKAINASGKPVLSLDLPSGLNG
ncbi:MAG: NAD(P)H-hydrate epimerase, partial [Planctomycetes bacterium]|nr:NAD(P)H-hydrate epimerase [Planctomycetota bacterium]